MGLPDIQRDGPRRIYEQLVDWMRGKIASEEWPENYQLQAEEDLAAAIGISRGTVRKAIAQLIDEDLLVRIHGRGTFVSSGIVEQPLAEQLITFSEDLILRGIRFETQVLDQRLMEPDPRVAAALRIENTEPVLFIKRVRVVEEEPVIVLDNYVCQSICPGIEDVDFTRMRLFETLEDKFNITLAGGRRTFEARLADEQVSNLLRLRVGDPIMYMDQVTSMRDGRPIEFSNLWLRADRYRISANLTRYQTTPMTTSLED